MKKNPTPTTNKTKAEEDEEENTNLHAEKMSFPRCCCYFQLCCVRERVQVSHSAHCRSISFTLSDAVRVSLVLIHLFIFIFTCVMCMPGGNLFFPHFFRSFFLLFRSAAFGLFVCNFALILSFCLFRNSVARPNVCFPECTKRMHSAMIKTCFTDRTNNERKKERRTIKRIENTFYFE